LVEPDVVSETMLPLESFTMVVMEPSLLKTSLVVVLLEELDPEEEDDEEDDELSLEDDVPNRLLSELLLRLEMEEDIWDSIIAVK